MRNLPLMIINWCVCSMSFYILGYFVNYFHGNSYMNGFLIGLADIIATILGRVLQLIVPTRIAFVTSFSVAAFFSVVYLIFQFSTFMVPITIVLMRCAVTTAFSMAYFGNQEYFPAQYQSTVFGVCNICSRFLTILAPLSVELIPQPIILVTIATVGSAVSSIFLKKPELPVRVDFEEANETKEA